MEWKDYTDSEYIPVSSLTSLSSEKIEKIVGYRKEFTEIIKVDKLTFASLVETPQLIKNRFIKNIELKEQFQVRPKDNDFILSIAISIIKHETNAGIMQKDLKSLINLYQKNGNDLTIITTYLIQELKFTDHEKEINFKKLLPELSDNEIKFIKNSNDIRYNYSLQDFQQLNKSSYETARKSLEKLSRLELYFKEKIGKKFIYKPSEKLINLVKGGA